MKGLLVVLSIVASSVVCEPPAPYPPSGWRPSGPAFELPVNPQSTPTRNQEYLPPVDPRRPLTPSFNYPEEDLSVQGLPSQEQVPIFQISPVNGQQYVGPSVNADVKNLDKSLNQIQFQNQQQTYRQFARQKQFEANNPQAKSNGLPSPQVPRQFARPAPTTPTTPATTESTTTYKPDDFKTQPDLATESLNQGEILEDDEPVNAKQKVSVEVSKQNVQEYPGELFLSGLAQLQLQPQFVPFQQLGQIRAPLYFQQIQQQSEKQVAGFDGPTHFAALPSVLAQTQGINAQSENIQKQQPLIQNPALLQPANPGFIVQGAAPLTQYQPIINGQYQPLIQPQIASVDQPLIQPQIAVQQPLAPQQQNFPQFQTRPVQVQPNDDEPEREEKDDEEKEEKDDQPQPQPQPQLVYQQAYQPQVQYQQPLGQVQHNLYQPQEVQFQQPLAQVQPNIYQQPQVQPNLYQPQEVQYQQPIAQPQPNLYQPQEVEYQQPLAQYQPNQYQPQEIQYQQFPQAQLNYQPQDQPLIQAQLVNYPQDLNQYYQSQLAQNQFGQQVQGQDSLQSGIDINPGNDIDQNDDEQKEDDENNTATAVATAFGARTQPRVFSQYGAPAPVPTLQTTTESQAEETTENGPAIAQATAVARGGRRKSAKLRSRRVRPVFTLDKSGHLVLAQEQ